MKLFFIYFFKFNLHEHNIFTTGLWQFFLHVSYSDGSGIHLFDALAMIDACLF